MPDASYFALNDDVDPGRPLHKLGIRIPLPTMRDGELVDKIVPVKIRQVDRLDAGTRARVIPATRIVEATDPLVVAALHNLPGLVHPIDPPDPKALRRATADTADARETAKQNSDQAGDGQED